MMFFALPLLALVSLNGYAWSENIGWMKFSGPTYQVQINDETGGFSGYGWSERVGWIKFFGDQARVCSATAGGDCSNEISENVSGWDGLIKLTTSQVVNYGVKVAGDETNGCYLNGYAWGSDVVGWVHMSGSGYQVNLERCIVPPTPPHTQDLSCSFSAAPKVLIPPQRTARLVWQCQDADACRMTPAIGAVSAISGARTVAPAQTTTYTLACDNVSGQSVSIPKTVKVINASLCEVNPADPSCE